MHRGEGRGGGMVSLTFFPLSSAHFTSFGFDHSDFPPAQAPPSVPHARQDQRLIYSVSRDLGKSWEPPLGLLQVMETVPPVERSCILCHSSSPLFSSPFTTFSCFSCFAVAAISNTYILPSSAPQHTHIRTHNATITTAHNTQLLSQSLTHTYTQTCTHHHKHSY
jgi:hypothetical protein